MDMAVYQGYRVFQELFVLFEFSDRLVLQPFKLSTLQYHTLLLLDTEEGWRLTDLSKRLLCERSTITRIVDYLESEGLVRRIADSEDRRAQRVVLTQAGIALRDAARAAHERSLEQHFSALSKAEQQQLRQFHQKLRSRLLADLEQSDQEL